MRIIKPSATLMEHNVTPYEFIERVGRTCYKSENRIENSSAEKFVKALVKSNHFAMVEHETIYLVVSQELMEDFLYDMQEYTDDLKYFNITFELSINIISGSFRSFHDLFEKGHTTNAIYFMQEVLQLAYPLVFGDYEYDNKHNSQSYDNGDCVLYTRQEFIETFTRPDILFKHLTHTIKFVCDRGVSHEFVRHRVASFAQESTRYCNYSKDKFGNEITVIKPCFFEQWDSELDNRCETMKYGLWARSCESSEKAYFELLNEGATPQEARTVLPNSLKTEIVITATEEEWQHIVNLRYLGTTGAPHPQMKEVMGLAVNDLAKESEGRIVV